MSSICCILNYPSHYRYTIYKLMAEKLNCDFYFGNIEDGRLKKFDFSLFPKEITQLQTKKIFVFNWIQGSVQLVFHPYKKYVLTGDIRCLSDWIILIFNRLRGKKTYLWTHGWYGDETTCKKTVKKIFLGLSHGLFLYGNYAKELMIKESYNKDKLHVIYNSLDYISQLPIRKSLEIENNHENFFHQYFSNTNPVLIFLGRLTKRKQLDLLIEAVYKLNNENNFPVNLVIVGKGEAENDLKNKSEKLNLCDKIWFFGKCYDEEINARLLYNADVCVSPGDVGLTAIHSFMFGCPVITHRQFQTQVPEFEIVEPDISGKFFEKNSVSDMTEKIREFLAYAKDNREKIRQAAYRRVDEYYNPYYQIEIFENILS